MDKKQKIGYILFLIVGFALILAFIVPKRIQERQCSAFAKPLYNHALPADMKLVQKSAAKDKSGGYTAALILAGAKEKDELLAFYSDTAYPPAKNGQTVTLAVKPLDESSLSALEQAGMREENQTYWFVYIYSC